MRSVIAVCGDSRNWRKRTCTDLRSPKINVRRSPQHDRCESRQDNRATRSSVPTGTRMGHATHRRTPRVSLSSVSLWARDVPLPTSRQTTETVVEAEGTDIGCRRCGLHLPLSAFTPSGRKDRRCKECVRSYFRRRGDLHRRQSAEAKRDRLVQAKRLLLARLVQSECRDCGTCDPLVLEFDHVGPKRADIAYLVGHGFSLPRIEEEMRACEVVCANCHRRRTARRAAWLRLQMGGSTARTLQQRNLWFVLDHLRTNHCVDCGEGDPLILDFDHVRRKRHGVADLVWSEHSLASIRQEIAECEVRCANCHRRRTSRVRQDLRHHAFSPP